MSTLLTLPIDSIKENQVSLRLVQKKKESYKELVDSIRDIGVLKPITVRTQKEEDGSTSYILVDGLQRWNAAKDAGLKEIDVKVTDVDQFVAQFAANAHTVETTPAQYGAHIQRIIAEKPGMSQGELVKLLRKSPGTIAKYLSLNELSDDAKKLTDEGKISLSNASTLAKLPVDEQDAFVEAAQTVGHKEFTPMIDNHLSALKKARREGKKEADAAGLFTPVSKFKKMSAIQDEISMGEAFGKVVGTETDAAKVWQLALKWVLNMDPASVETQRSAYFHALEDAKKRKEAALAERKAKREAAVPAA